MVTPRYRDHLTGTITDKRTVRWGTLCFSIDQTIYPKTARSRPWFRVVAKGQNERVHVGYQGQPYFLNLIHRYETENEDFLRADGRMKQVALVDTKVFDQCTE